MRAASSIAQYRPASPSSVKCRNTSGGVLTDADVDAGQLSEHLEEPGSVAWVDIVEPDADELTLIADELALHELAVEDAIYASGPSWTASPIMRSCSRTPFTSSPDNGQV